MFFRDLFIFLHYLLLLFIYLDIVETDKKHREREEDDMQQMPPAGLTDYANRGRCDYVVCVLPRHPQDVILKHLFVFHSLPGAVSPFSSIYFYFMQP